MHHDLVITLQKTILSQKRFLLNMIAFVWWGKKMKRYNYKLCKSWSSEIQRQSSKDSMVWVALRISFATSQEWMVIESPSVFKAKMIQENIWKKQERGSHCLVWPSGTLRGTIQQTGWKVGLLRHSSSTSLSAPLSHIWVMSDGPLITHIWDPPWQPDAGHRDHQWTHLRFLKYLWSVDVLFLLTDLKIGVSVACLSYLGTYPQQL